MKKRRKKRKPVFFSEEGHAALKLAAAHARRTMEAHVLYLIEHGKEE